ncbi:hypothetical protein CVT24_011073, partial [Panaeolus cyanescens]
YNWILVELLRAFNRFSAVLTSTWVHAGYTVVGVMVLAFACRWVLAGTQSRVARAMEAVFRQNEEARAREMAMMARMEERWAIEDERAAAASHDSRTLIIGSHFATYNILRYDTGNGGDNGDNNGAIDTNGGSGHNAGLLGDIDVNGDSGGNQASINQEA